MLSESITISGLSGAKTLTYAYDTDGNRSSLIGPDGTTTTYTYTPRNQVAEIATDGPPPLATFTYDAAGRRTQRTLENGITSTYAYDDGGRLTSLSHGSSIETLTYIYDTMNRRTGENRSFAPARTFGYDLTSQLTAVNQSSGTATFAYDAVGNRTTVTGAPGAGSYTANNLNQYSTAGSVGLLTCDANGNLATGGGWTYTHNGNSRLVSASGPGSVSASFGRDGRNRDVKRTINGATTYLIYDGWSLVAEYDGSGVLSSRYIHGSQVDEVLAKITSASTIYPLPDALGSTIAVTAANGAVLERIYYSDAFGTPTFKDANGTTISGTSTGTRFLFTGREWLTELNLYDYRNRTYSAELGRFIETDPIRFEAGDVNLLRIVHNSPLNLLDPRGLCWSRYEAFAYALVTSGGAISLEDTGCVGEVEAALKDTFEESITEIKSKVSQAAKANISCPSGGNATVSGSLSDRSGIYSGVWWIGGIQRLSRAYECQISADCGTCNFKGRCKGTFNFRDNWEHPFDLDNNNQDPWDDWEVGAPWSVVYQWTRVFDVSGSL